MLGEQSGEVLDVARRLRGTHGHLAAVASRLRAHRVVAPAQREGADAAMPGRKPARHLQHQAPRAEQQGRREFDACHQLQLRAERVGQLGPPVCFGSQAVGLIECAEQLGIEAPTEASTGQGTHLAQGSATQSDQGGVMHVDGRQRVDREGVQKLVEGLRETVRLAGAGERDGG